MKKISVFFISLVLFSCKNIEKPNIPELVSNSPSHTTTSDKTPTQSVPDNNTFQYGNTLPSAILSPTPRVETGVFQDIEGNYHLKYIFEEGKTYKYNIRSVGRQTVTYMEQTQTVKEETTEPISLTVTNINNGVYTFNVKMNGHKTVTEVEGKKQVIDINGKAPDLGKEQMVMWRANKILKNSSFTMIMDAYGNISKISGLEPIYSKVQSSIGKDLTQEQQKEMMAIMKQSFGEESLKVLFQSNMVRFPEKGLKVGEKWVPNPADKNSGYVQLVKVDENTTEVKISGKIPSQSDSKIQDGVTIKASMSGTQSGKIILDNKSGWVSKANLITNITETRTAKKGEQTNKMVQKMTNTTYINN